MPVVRKRQLQRLKRPAAARWFHASMACSRLTPPNVKPEDLIRDIGDKCGIKIVVFGEAFDDKPIGVKFQQMPVRMGIQRVLRIANMPNFVLHFDNSTSPRIVELDLMGKKGGERQLTSGAGRPAPSGPASAPASTPASVPASVKAPEKQDAPDKRAEKKTPSRSRSQGPFF